jgi:hypothetical protein
MIARYAKLSMNFLGLMKMPAPEATAASALARGHLHNLWAWLADGHDLSGSKFAVRRSTAGRHPRAHAGIQYSRAPEFNGEGPAINNGSPGRFAGLIT